MTDIHTLNRIPKHLSQVASLSVVTIPSSEPASFHQPQLASTGLGHILCPGPVCISELLHPTIQEVCLQKYPLVILVKHELPSLGCNKISNTCQDFEMMCRRHHNWVS